MFLDVGSPLTWTPNDMIILNQDFLRNCMGDTM
jgi:hypothetical protein